MLRMHQTTSAAGAKSYYESLSKGDYYARGQEVEIVGRWGGRGAALLNLRGDVERDAFNALCDNLNPHTGERLTARKGGNRTVLYDMTFSVDKSVSVVHALTGDDRILEAFRRSVGETMREMERGMMARVRKGGVSEDRVTGNMVWGEFVHLTTRPVDGVPDPHLHAHMTVFNATFDRREGQWKAGQFRELKRDAPYYEAAFRSRLALRLQDLGYQVERSADGKDWRLATVPESVRSKFSRRTAEIEARATELGITYAEDKAQLGAKTRQGKARDLSYGELKSTWDSWLTPEERDALHGSSGNGRTPGGGVTARQAVDYALAHSYERRSVVSEKQLLAEALRYGFGSPEAGIDAIKQELAARPEIITGKQQGQTLVTTRQVWEEERSMVLWARAGRGTMAPLKRQPHVFQPINVGGKSWELNAGQKQGVSHILQSRDRVIALRGGAGVGKTALMREAVAAIEESGQQVFTFAPSADASRGVLRQEGFATADTVQRLLVDTELQKQVKNGVIWVDEAGLLSVKAMNSLFRVAEAQNARVVLSGDIRQHSAVERGDAMRILEREAAIAPVEVTEIVRQKGAYREAVALLSKGEVTKGFDRLDRLGWVVDGLPPEKLHRKLADDYLEATSLKKANGDHLTALVVSPTHREGEVVTGLIRQGLRQQGKLGDAREFNQQVNLSWTRPQKQDSRNYQKGQVLQFDQNARGIERGERLTVAGRDTDGNIVGETSSGQRKLVPLDQSDRFQVYEARQLDLATGDKIRITRNGFAAGGQRLNNGALYEVAGFTREGNIRLNNGWVVAGDYANLTHGYVTTSHASQGKTVDRVFIAQTAESFPASFAEQFYVSVSRGRESVKIYTDDKQLLREEVKQSASRLSALELAQAPPEEAARQRRAERTTLQLEMMRRWAEYVGNQIDRGLDWASAYGRDIVRELNRGREDWALDR